MKTCYNGPMYNYVKRVRQDLHQIPELELNLPKTKQYVLNELKNLPCTIESPIDSSVIAYFDNQKETTVAFRSDMDALPVLEKMMYLINQNMKAVCMPVVMMDTWPPY